MTDLLRDYEFKCLIDLIPHMNFKKEWLPLYKNWNKLEYYQHINQNIISNWVKYVYYKKNNKSLKKNFVDYQKSMKGYPLDIKKKNKDNIRKMWYKECENKILKD